MEKALASSCYELDSEKMEQLVCLRKVVNLPAWVEGHLNRWYKKRW